jgi:hypothetical protein
MNIRSQRIGVYCGWVFVGMFLLGFVVLAGFLPPPNPAASALEIQQRFADNTLRIRLGMLVCLFSSAILLWWLATVATQIKRIEGRHSPVTYLWIAASGGFVIEFVYPLMFWAVTAFRPGDSADLVRKFNDLAWLTFLGIVSTAIVQIFAFAYVILTDTRHTPVFPRWFGYFNFWCALIFVPADLIFFFKTGPLAWNGLVSFYLVFIVFAIWLVVVTIMTGRAVTAQEADPDDDPLDTAELAARVAALGAKLDRLTTEVGGSPKTTQGPGQAT